jgi:hypothetical protein
VFLCVWRSGLNRFSAEPVWIPGGHLLIETVAAEAAEDDEQQDNPYQIGVKDSVFIAAHDCTSFRGIIVATGFAGHGCDFLIKS